MPVFIIFISSQINEYLTNGVRFVDVIFQSMGPTPGGSEYVHFSGINHWKKHGIETPFPTHTRSHLYSWSPRQMKVCAWGSTEWG